jgi:16S rRNA (adenine1518-N6/adenine1519-N6)-dimethyltransferase
VKLSEIKQALAEGDIQLTRSLGQNFLHDIHQLQRIVHAARLSKHDHVLEIGPGLGPLTEFLLKEAGEVMAIETDQRLVELLRRRFHSAKNLRLLHDDALDFLRRKETDWAEWKLVANLPYSVASPILVELALAPGSPRLLVTTLQLEVARRLVARADDAEYGVLTLLVQLRYTAGDWFKIPAACFFPAPKVDSACVTLERRTKPLLPWEVERTFVRVVKRAFSQRRKMMLKLLKQDWPAELLEMALANVGLDLTIRGEAVSLEAFARLALALHGAGNAQDFRPDT